MYDMVWTKSTTLFYAGHHNETVTEMIEVGARTSAEKCNADQNTVRRKTIYNNLGHIIITFHRPGA